MGGGDAREMIRELESGVCFLHAFNTLAVEEILGWKGFQSDWLTLCPVKGGELVQLDVDLKVFGSSPSWAKLQSGKPIYQ